MRRHRHRSAARRVRVVLLLASVALTFALAGLAGAQTTVPPTTVPTTTPASTLSPPTTVAGGGTATTLPQTATTVPSTTTTDATDSEDSDDSGLPWIPIAIAIVVLLLIIVAVAILARRRGAARQAVDDWRSTAADATAEAGATARLLSGGTPVSGQIAQQLITSLRTFEDIAASAPDASTAATAERARRAIQTLGLAIDADYRMRRAQPAPPAERLAQSQEAVQAAASETDRTLRGVYRSFTGAG